MKLFHLHTNADLLKFFAFYFFAFVLFVFVSRPLPEYIIHSELIYNPLFATWEQITYAISGTVFNHNVYCPTW